MSGPGGRLGQRRKRAARKAAACICAGCRRASPRMPPCGGAEEGKQWKAHRGAINRHLPGLPVKSSRHHRIVESDRIELRLDEVDLPDRRRAFMSARHRSAQIQALRNNARIRSGFPIYQQGNKVTRNGASALLPLLPFLRAAARRHLALTARLVGSLRCPRRPPAPDIQAPISHAIHATNRKLRAQAKNVENKEFPLDGVLASKLRPYPKPQPAGYTMATARVTRHANPGR